MARKWNALFLWVWIDTMVDNIGIKERASVFPMCGHQPCKSLKFSNWVFFVWEKLEFPRPCEKTMVISEIYFLLLQKYFWKKDWRSVFVAHMIPLFCSSFLVNFWFSMRTRLGVSLTYFLAIKFVNVDYTDAFFQSILHIRTIIFGYKLIMLKFLVFVHAFLFI